MSLSQHSSNKGKQVCLHKANCIWCAQQQDCINERMNIDKDHTFPQNAQRACMGLKLRAGTGQPGLPTCSRLSFSLFRMSSMSSRARSKSCRSFCQYFSSSFTALVFSSCSFCKTWVGWDKKHHRLSVFPSFSRNPLRVALRVFLLLPCLLFRPCPLLPPAFSCLTERTSAPYQWNYPKLSCSFTLGTHFSVCSFTPSLLLHPSLLQRLEFFCALEQQPKALTQFFKHTKRRPRET